MRHPNKQHFSHHHILLPLQLEQDEEINCTACNKQITGPFHGCLSCNFYLHDACADAPRSLHHSSHLAHPLTLLPSPTYPTRSFDCNACGSQGKAFSFTCAHCEFDLHVQCACMPSTIILENYHPHELKILFSSPYEDKNTVFSCDVCSEIMNPDQWLYYCQPCDFGAHLGCTKQSRKVNQEEQEEEEEEIKAISKVSSGKKEKSVFEAQRELQEKMIAQKLILEALDNAGSYVGGSSYTTKYYYY